MQTRHYVDTSTWFDADAEQPDSREVEDPLATLTDAPPPLVTVEREPYRISVGLESAVNLAIGLGRPLLLQGDPGVGKTRLAYAVAYALGLPLEVAPIKSTNRGRDLLYTYDAVRRLHDVQLRSHLSDDVRQYIRLGPLGRVIARAEYGRRSVLLIDEIDKADLDFPNDLLHELDALAFTIDEVPGGGHRVPTDRPELRPIIVVTNNEEKALPGAFLRRCIFHYVEFPESPADLDEIIAMHGVARPELRSAVIETVLRLRDIELAKKPGLSELLDWAGFLQAVGTPPADVEHLPYPEALLKQRGDQTRAMDRLSRP